VVDERIRTEHAVALAEIETLRAQMADMLGGFPEPPAT
jgi:hypothetical protein